MWFIIFGILTFSVNQVLGNLRIVSPSQNIKANPGERVALPCEVQGKTFNLFKNPIIWYKVTPTETIQLNTNGAISDLIYYETGRFSMDANVTMSGEPWIKMNLIISGIQQEDGGVYQCELRKINGVVSQLLHTVIVVVPVSSLTFSINNTHLSDGDTITLASYPSTDTKHYDLGSPVIISKVPVVCSTIGGNPQPDLYISHSGTSIDHVFTHNVSSAVYGDHGFLKTDYVTELKNDSFIFTRDFHNTQLKCSTSILGGSKQTITVNIKLTYGPEFYCERDVTLADLPPKLNITCLIAANPAIGFNNVNWGSNAGHTNISHTIVQTQDTSSTVNDSSLLSVTLYIDNMTDASLGVYRLTAKNHLRQNTIYITVKRAHPTTVVPLSVSEEYLVGDGALKRSNSTSLSSTNGEKHLEEGNHKRDGVKSSKPSSKSSVESDLKEDNNKDLWDQFVCVIIVGAFLIYSALFSC